VGRFGAQRERDRFTTKKEILLSFSLFFDFLVLLVGGTITNPKTHEKTPTPTSLLLSF
jgi:hypothetical protein